MSPLRAIGVLVTVASFVLFAAPARSGESFDNCTGTISTLPATIGAQGVWCLKRDLATAITTGAAITIAANNVTIDCNDFKVGGFAAGPNTYAYGISVVGRSNSVVRRCNVRGFSYGVHAEGGAGHVVEDNRIVGSTIAGILIVSNGSTIRRNHVTETGSDIYDYAFGIFASDGVDVLENTVVGVSMQGYFELAGIKSNWNHGATISGNRISDLHSELTDVVAVLDEYSNRSIIEGNFLIGPDTAGSIAIACKNGKAMAVRNVITGFDQPVAVCHADANLVNPN